MLTQMHEKWKTTDDTKILDWLLKITNKMEQNCFEFGQKKIMDYME